MEQFKPIKIVDTTFRDAHQSLMATRMRTEDMLPICSKMDKLGFFAMEVWGGATFDVCIRYLNEDPWDRLKKLRENLPNTKLMMLLRGQNLVGYRHYSDDVVEKFVYTAKKNGIDIFRIFDALNDIRNMEKAIKSAKDCGAEVQGTIAYTTSPVHTISGFVDLAQKLEELGADYICIKDMAGLISPKSAYELVTELKKYLKVPIDLHTHSTSGMGLVSYYSAILAGVDIVDTAFSPFAGGSSQPALENLLVSLADTPYRPAIDLNQVIDISYYFLALRKKYQKFISPTAEITDASVVIHQIPGGMLSNLYAQLKEQNALDKYEEVLRETPRVRADLGYPPLVTPTSQIIGIQAVMNVLSQKRYDKISKEVKDYCLGLYGQPPAPICKEMLHLIIGDQTPITTRPADLIPPDLENRRKEAEKLGILRKGREDEDLLTYTLFPQIAIKFLHGIVEQKADEEIETISQNATEENYKVAAIAVALFDYFAKYKTVNKNPIAKEISGWKLQARRENLRSN
ncbi:MAG: pyruvate carboxylase subunit B [candidate division WOR-3 bacterium]|nr:pyruvate carboxylase subunit B [candidate division WOR-3 bacterium]